MANTSEIKQLQDMANIMRRDVLKSTTAAGSGHPTSCMSCAEIMSVLYFHEMRYDVKNPSNPDNDEFVLSKGHAAPILYSALFRAGAVKENLDNLRKYGSQYEGHPVPQSFPWAKVATGSLGQGLSNALGMAIAMKMQKRTARTYVLLGDSESAEGSNYEALELAVFYKIDNLCVIIDINRLGQSRETMLGHDIEGYKRRFASFSSSIITVDGHNVEQLINAFDSAKKTKGGVTIILAKTYKGKGVSFLENKENWHGKAVPKDMLGKALNEIPNPSMPPIKIAKPAKTEFMIRKITKKISPAYKKGDLVATREAYGRALADLDTVDNMLIALDGETSNSTFAEALQKKDPAHYIESFIAEQNMVGMAVGLSKKGYHAFVSTFACFLTRAHDQIRMASLSDANMTLVGSHSGVSIGDDGCSQMALDDLAMMRSTLSATVFYPSDPVCTERIVELSTKIKGIKYIRTSRPKTPVIYNNNETFRVGDFKVLKRSDKDSAVLVGAGITLHEALKAHEELKKKGISTAVIDCYCLKPFNARKFVALAKRCKSKVIVVEDHYPEGGLGSMIFEAVVNNNIHVSHLAVRKFPHSGPGELLLKKQGIDSSAIVREVRSIVKK